MQTGRAPLHPTPRNTHETGDSNHQTIKSDTLSTLEKSTLDGLINIANNDDWKEKAMRSDIPHVDEDEKFDRFEFDILLHEKPESNVFTYQIETDGLDFFYQPELTEEEVEEVRQYVVLDSAVKYGELKEIGDKRFIRMAGQFVNIDDLHIDLIDRINPFQKAFEILSKSVTTKVLKVIQDVIEATRIQVSEEEAVLLWPKIKDFYSTFKREPGLNTTDPLERRMAEVLIYIKEQKRKQANA